jgi:hypothetical protein
MSSQAFTKPVRLLRAHWLISLFVTASIGFFIWQWTDFMYGQTPCPPGVARHAPHEITHETCPSLGRMNGVKLAIPQHYLLGPKGYKGIDIWNAESYKKRPQTNSFDNELDNFAIKIRLTNFKPIETTKDRDDYGNRSSPAGPAPVENRWIHVGIEANGYSQSFQPTVNRWIKDEKGWGPFKPVTDQWGMVRYLSAQLVTPTSSQWEFLHDPNFATLVICEHMLLRYPPHTPSLSCELMFFLHETKALIKVSGLNASADLARWPEIEREVRKVIQSFIVP